MNQTSDTKTPPLAPQQEKLPHPGAGRGLLPGNLLPPQRQQKLRKAGAGFLALMLALTVLSRVASSLTVPVVETDSPQNTFLTHTTSAQGAVKPNGLHAVVLESGMLLQSVEVEEGQAVQAGDPLLTLDLEHLDRKLEGLELELRRLKLGASSTAEPPLDTGELELARAQEDLQRAQEEQERAVKRAKQDLEDTIERWEQADASHLEGILYGEAGDEGDEDQDSYVNPYETEYRAAQRAYQDAKARQEQALLEAQRRVEDAQLQIQQNQASRRQQQSAQAKESAMAALDLQLKQRELDRYRQYRQAGGEIRAQQNGVVTGVQVTPGQLTTGETALMLADQTQGCRLEVELTPSQLGQVSRGDQASVLLTGSQTPLQTTVESVSLQSDGSALVTVQLPQVQDALGRTGKLTVERRTGNYPLCLPVTALRQDHSGHYVLKVEQRQGVLGSQEVAVRIPVQVLDQNATQVAVDGLLTADDTVITGSSRQISEGDRVRLGV